MTTGRPVIPVFVLDPETEALGGAPKWRLGLGVERFSSVLETLGSRLILRRGDALTVLTALAVETGARSVVWSRLCDPASRARDEAVKAGLKSAGIEARSFPGHLLFEPWTVTTGQGGYYRVYTPYWRAVKDREVPAPLSAPVRLPAPDSWPASERLTGWHLGAAMRRGADVVRPHLILGEDAARDRLSWFVEDAIGGYSEARDRVAEDGTSRLSQCLATGEISVRVCWHAGLRALHEGKRGAETFLKELVWRDFAHHLAYHTPHIVQDNWKPEWDAFPWSSDSDAPHARAWQQGRTGIPFVDAGMREMYVTGTMHNRARMIVASYLTKHLMTHWRVGLNWFEDCLVDWDPASNAMGWQWSAGSGPDAAPYFRVFNPVSQAEKFDPTGAYRRRWIAEISKAPPESALSYFDAIPRAWAYGPTDRYPAPIMSPEDGRARALAAYAARASG